MGMFLFLMGKNNLLLHLQLLTIIVVHKIEQDDCVIIQQSAANSLFVHS